MDQESLRNLILTQLDGQLSDEEFAALEDRLATDSAARELYAELAQLDAELRDLEAVPDALKLDSRPLLTENPSRSGSRSLLVALCLSVAALLFLELWPHGAPVEPQPVPKGNVIAEAEPEDEVSVPIPDTPIESIAVISAEAEAVWDHAGSTRGGPGTALVSGRLILKEGYAQIDFFSGASVTLSGPAEIELIDKKLAILHSGQLRANVPPAARGFEIRAADVRLEDLGTSFGISVEQGGDAEVVVYDGEVRAIDQSGETMALLEGDSAHLQEGAALRQSSQNLKTLPDMEILIKRAGGRKQTRYRAWREAAEERRNDPRLIAYYDFEGLKTTTRRLTNRALANDITGVDDPSELDGGIVGARVIGGRWPGKKALDFRGEGDRVRFQIPGEFDAVTLYAWVRIDALDRRLNSLFLTDYFDPGEIHWQISTRGSLHFSTSPAGVPEPLPGMEEATIEQIQEHNRWFWSEEFWDASQSGKWFFLATTADRNAKQQVTHYINGQPVGFSGGVNLEKTLPKMRIGGADLGNWTDPIRRPSIRSLNGRIDEFAIYSEALSAEEIRELYELGRP